MIEIQYNQDEALDQRIEEATELIAEKSKGLKSTYNKIVDTLAKIRVFYQGDIDKFLVASPEKMLKKSYLGIFQPYSRLWLPEGVEIHTPEITTVDTVALEVKNHNKIVLLGGASISSLSNLNLLSDEGEWTMRNCQYSVKLQALMTKKSLQEHPAEIWRWHHEVKKSFTNKGFNKAQSQIAEYQLHCSLNSKRFDLATLSIDGQHKAALDDHKKKMSRMSSRSIQQRNHPQIFELMGDINYRRCSEACPSNLNPGADYKLSEGVVPKCRRCGMNSRPHVLLNDEDYSSADYGVKECMARLEKADCLIVVDSNYGTSAELKMIEFALKKGISVIEIGPNPKIEYGKNVKQVIGNPVEIVSDLLKKAKEL